MLMNQCVRVILFVSFGRISALVQGSEDDIIIENHFPLINFSQKFSYVAIFLSGKNLMKMAETLSRHKPYTFFF